MNNKVSIVIITKDTKELLENLLNSIEKDLSLQPFIGKIIIVDNASTDATGEMVREKYPSVLYVRNEKNMGFAFSVNKGSSLAEDEYILFLNSDTILIQGELGKMVRFMGGNTNVAICGPQLVYPDMKLQRSFAAVPSLWGEVFPQKGAKGQAPTPAFKDVDTLIGAAILVRREILKAIGGFDEQFFFFLEETDLCVRVRQTGYRVVFFPWARVVHLQGKTVRKNWISGRMEYNISLHKFIKKHHRPIYYGTFVAVRFVKAFILSILFPLFFLGERMRMKYIYCLRLITWYFMGCPDNAGLRPEGL